MRLPAAADADAARRAGRRGRSGAVSTGAGRRPRDLGQVDLLAVVGGQRRAQRRPGPRVARRDQHAARPGVEAMHEPALARIGRRGRALGKARDDRVRRRAELARPPADATGSRPAWRSRSATRRRSTTHREARRRARSAPRAACASRAAPRRRSRRRLRRREPAPFAATRPSTRTAPPPAGAARRRRSGPESPPRPRDRFAARPLRRRCARAPRPPALLLLAPDLSVPCRRPCRRGLSRCAGFVGGLLRLVALLGLQRPASWPASRPPWRSRSSPSASPSRSPSARARRGRRAPLGPLLTRGHPHRRARAARRPSASRRRRDRPRGARCCRRTG